MRNLFVLVVIDLHLFCVGPIVGDEKKIEKLKIEIDVRFCTEIV